jgi:hypothetical protein
MFYIIGYFGLEPIGFIWVLGVGLRLGKLFLGLK